MKSWILKREMDTAPPEIRLRMDVGTGAPAVWCLTNPFKVGRDAECEVRIDDGAVSRTHAEVYLEAGTWWIRDLGSTNGTYVDDARTSRARLADRSRLQFGREGPVLYVSVEHEPAGPRPSGRSQGERGTNRAPHVMPQDAPAASSRKQADGAHAGPDPSVESYIRKYFSSDAGSAGDHTRMIRRAYSRVHERHQRKYVGIFSVLGALLVLVGGYAIFQESRIQRFERLAADAFYDMKEMDARLAQLKSVLEETNDTSLSDLLADLEESRRESRATYEVYVEELGIRRALTPEEEVIYRMATIFNESETEVPAEFIREIREGIRFWQVQGRSSLVSSIERANREGYTESIVRTMQQYGLPPQLFYLALQESKFDAEAVGPPTRYGFAKGMWQFIPETGERYGLEIGGLADYRQPDAQDDRHDFERSTDAAARYLRDIYGQLTQASGLLAMASYNWGERRVVSKMEELLEDIPDDPRARSYWRFYEEYSARMPEETKDYVRKIFAAAVIGEDPELFGFTFENPLAAYIEAGHPAEQQLSSR